MAVRVYLLLFLSVLNVCLSLSYAASDCPAEQLDETSEIRYVYDGDTLQLSDGRKVRLIGINAPELAHDRKAAEFFAVEAKNALSSLFRNEKSIALVYGKDKKDHYGRQLAHVFSTDGQNIQAILLAQGYASAIAIPPNIQFASCYLEMESHARCSRKGLWKDSIILETTQLDNQASGFHLIRGKVIKIDTGNKGIWLNLDHKLTIGIRSDNLPLFDIKAINAMLNQTVIIRGWLSKSNKSTPYYLRIRHPLSLQLYSDFSCEDQ